MKLKEIEVFKAVKYTKSSKIEKNKEELEQLKYRKLQVFLELYNTLSIEEIMKYNEKHMDETYYKQGGYYTEEQIKLRKLHENRYLFTKEEIDIYYKIIELPEEERYIYLHQHNYIYTPEEYDLYFNNIKIPERKLTLKK